MIDKPKTLLVDPSGSFMAVTASVPIPSNTSGLLVAGVDKDGIIRYPVIDNIGSIQITGSAIITGSVGISNAVSIGPVTGTVELTGTGSVIVTAIPNVTGSVNVTNTLLTVTGSVGITNGLTIISHPAITGTVALTGTGSVIVTSLPNVTGSVNITNSFLNVTGSVGITNGINVLSQPAVTGTVALTGTGSVIVTSLPNVTGSVNVTNSVLPITGTITGSVTVYAESSLPVFMNGGVTTLSLGNSPSSPLFVQAGSPVGAQYFNVRNTVALSVKGFDPSGSTAASEPVGVAGIDNIGVVRTILTDNAGRQIVTGTVNVVNSISTPLVIAGSSSTGIVTVPQVDKILGQSVNQLSVASTITSPGAAPRGAYAYVNAYGSLRVSPESTSLFNEQFDGFTLDANRWTSAASGTAAGVTIGGGSASISAGANANSYAYLQSIPTFSAYGTTFEIYGAVATFFGASTNCYKFLGTGTPKTTPTAASPLFDGVGFEQDVTGSLTAVIYSSGTLAYKSAPLTPAPGFTPGRYGFHLRSDLILFYYPTTEYPIASVNFTGSYVQQLPILNLAVNNTSAPSTTSGLRIQNQSINDSGKNSIAIGDATYPWRKATVDATGSLQTIVTGSVVVSVLPSITGSVGITNGITVISHPAVTGTVAAVGAQAPGATLTANPVTIAGVDSSNIIHGVFTNPTGAIGVFLSNPDNNSYAATSIQNPPATPTDIFTLAGSATKLVRVTRINLSSTQSAAGTNQFFIVKRSAANSGGTSSTPTIVPFDSISPAASAVFRSYSANPTTGSAVGTLYALKIFTPSVTTAPAVTLVTIDLTNGGQSRGVILRGTAQQLAINFGGAALPTSLNVNGGFEWVEE